MWGMRGTGLLRRGLSSSARREKTAHVLLNQRITAAAAAAAADPLHGVNSLLVQTPLASFNLINCATALRVLSKQQPEYSPSSSSSSSSSSPTKRQATAWVLQALEQLLCFHNQEQQQASADVQTLSLVFHSLATGQLTPSPPDWLLTSALRAIDQFDDSRALATIASALAKFPQAPPPAAAAAGSSSSSHRELLHGIARQSKPILGKFLPQEQANLVWALAKLGHLDGELMQQVSHHVKTALTRGGTEESYSSQALSTILWAHATLGVRDRDLCLAVSHSLLAATDAAAITATTTSTSIQSYCNTVWSLAVMGVEVPAMLCKVERELDLSGFSSVGLTNAIWSLAKFERFSEFPRFAHEVLRRERQQNNSKKSREGERGGDFFNSRNRVNILWAFAKQPQSDAKLVAANAQFCGALLRNITNMDELVPSYFSMLVWATARINSPELMPMDRVCRAMTTAMMKRKQKKGSLSTVDSFNLHALSVILTSLTRARHFDAKLVDCVVDRLLDILGGGGGGGLRGGDPHFAHQMSVILHSLALMTVDDGGRGSEEDKTTRLCLQIARGITAQWQRRPGLQGFTGQDLTQVVWSFACLDLLDRPEVQALLATSPPSTSAVRMDRSSVAAAQQLYETILAWQQSKPPGTPLPGLLRWILHDGGCGGGMEQESWIDALVRQDLERVMKSSSSPSSSSSSPTRVQQAAFTLLKPYLPNLQFEHHACGLSVDMFAQPNLVIEVDGPFHYFANLPEKRIGSTLFKKRLLERAGYLVYTIPTAALHRLSDDVGKQREMLKKLAAEMTTAMDMTAKTKR